MTDKNKYAIRINIFCFGRFEKKKFEMDLSISGLLVSFAVKKAICTNKKLDIKDKTGLIKKE